MSQLFQKLNIGKVSDVSFANLFWKKFVLRLVVLCIISGVLLSIAQPLVISICKDFVEREVNDAALQLIQKDDFDLSDNRLRTVQNMLLAKSQNKISNNRFVTNSSLALYNLSTRQHVISSFEIPFVDSEDFLTWWAKQSEIKNGYPSIVLSEEMMDFCKQHSNDELRLTQAYCLNTVVFASEVLVFTVCKRRCSPLATAFL
jgi:hypothetical protein